MCKHSNHSRRRRHATSRRDGTSLATTLVAPAAEDIAAYAGIWTIDMGRTKGSLDPAEQQEFENMAMVMTSFELTLNPDGSASVGMMGMLKDGFWTAQQQAVTVTIDNAKTLTVDGQHLAMDEAGRKMFFQRSRVLTADDATTAAASDESTAPAATLPEAATDNDPAGLVGTWTVDVDATLATVPAHMQHMSELMRPTLDSIVLTFAADGTTSNSLMHPMTRETQTKTGTYTATASTLTVTMDDGSENQPNSGYVLDGDSLIIINSIPDGPARMYLIRQAATSEAPAE